MSVQLETPHAVAAAIGLSGVSKRYGRTRAVQALDLEVTPGEVVTVVGESGCGKSTLLRLVAGLEHPDTGSVSIAGTTVADARTALPPERRRVGMVFQDHALFPHLDVAANIGFGLRASAPAVRRERVADVLDLVGLTGAADRYPHQLSGGEQQRVALARALAPRPAAVLLDEPFSSLDENLRARVRVDTLTILRESGAAAVVVTHDQDEALMMGDRIAVLRAGAAEQIATPPEVYERPATRYVATFIGDADFLPARSRDGWWETELGPVPRPADEATGQVDLLLRPHQVAIDVIDRETPAGPGVGDVVRTEYHGAATLHEIRLLSGRVIRSRRQGRLVPVGTRVQVSVPGGARALHAD